jgi:hypothetical protein
MERWAFLFLPPFSGASGFGEPFAGYKPAIRQIENLRYVLGHRVAQVCNLPYRRFAFGVPPDCQPTLSTVFDVSIATPPRSSG